jgi:holo-[acyl-carrier protein] synthase
MSVYGIGIDLVKVERIQRILDRWGEQFKKRIFSHEEWEACSTKRGQASCLAMRFAAKEAFVKALGTGIRSPVRWRDIEVLSNDLGKPYILLSKRASDFCKTLGVISWHLSLTDDGEYGAAVVITEC